MPKDPQKFANLLGAKIVGEMPDVGGGPFGMARLAHIMHQRLTPSQGERPGRPTDSTWATRPKVPMSEATRQRLVEIAEAMSTPERRVSPMQVAAQLLEEAVVRVPSPPRSSTSLGSVHNPWERLPQQEPFVLPEDASLVAEFNETASEKLTLHLELLPEPFLGRSNAPVVLLNANPGYSPAGDGRRVHCDPRFAASLRRNLLHRHLSGEYPFYLLDPACPSGGQTWWERILRCLIEQVGQEAVARGVFCVEYLPYHSQRFRHGRLRLPSQQYSFSLVRDAIRREAIIVLMRKERLWFAAVPELASYRRLYRVNPRNPAISPRNCPGGFRHVLNALRGVAEQLCLQTPLPDSV
jgi:hypothetical protein